MYFRGDFEASLKRVVNEPFVQEFLHEPRNELIDLDVELEVIDHKNEIERDLASEIQRVDDSARDYFRVRGRVDDDMNSRLAARVGGSGILLLVLLAIALLALLLFNRPLAQEIISPRRAFFAHVSLDANILWVRSFWGAALAGVGGIAIFVVEGAVRAKTLRAEFERKHDVEGARYTEQEVKRQFETLLDARIRQEVVSLFNSHRADARQNAKIFVSERVGLSRRTSAFGLSEVPERDKIASTAVRTELERLITELKGASIGISGPRGVGKSTLLASICDSELKIAGKMALTINSAAPVEYDGRAFLLHLFSTLCLKTLSREMEEDRSTSPVLTRMLNRLLNGRTAARTFTLEELAAEPMRTWRDNQALQHTRPFARMLVGVGMFFCLVSLALAALQPYSAPQAAPDAKRLAVAAKSAAPQLSPSGKPSEPAPVMVVTSPSQSLGERTMMAWTSGLQAGPLALFGVVAFTLGFALYVNIAFTRLWDATSRETGILRSPQRGLIERNELVKYSLDQLRNIRFQRSFTSGWSGGVKAPAVFEIGATGSVSYAQNPESLPELVERFRLYVAELVRRYGRVVIGIDELDKLKSAQDGEAFLNGVKSVFNIPGCFFLVSVSEHALASFERRGVGFRDAFDSALDLVLQLDYCDLTEAEALLGSRILRWPRPFLFVAQMMSGGLPRDLIRTARDMLTIAATFDERGATLEEVTRQLVLREAAAKIRATSISLRLADANHDASDLLLRVAELSEFDDIVKLAEHAQRFRAVLEAEIKGVAEPGRRILLCLELSVYLSLLAQIHRVAILAATPAGYRRVDRDGVCDKVTEVRQALEVSMPLAAARLRVATESVAAARRAPSRPKSSQRLDTGDTAAQPMRQGAARSRQAPAPTPSRARRPKADA